MLYINSIACFHGHSALMGHILTCYQLMKIHLPYLYNTQPYIPLSLVQKLIFVQVAANVHGNKATLTVEYCPIFDDSFTGEYYGAYINWIIIINE